MAPTAVDPISPFDSTTLRHSHVLSEPPAHRETQLSDPPTALVRPDGFRELLPGTIVDETYEIDAKLGAGAMGEVYAARHVKLGKRVAIKVIGKKLSEDSAAIERFAMEARTLAQIQHPAIVAVDNVGELTDGRAYFSMELLRGESLQARLARGRISLSKALRILDQMARGLEAAHAQGVTHRDLKPENTYLVRLPGEASIVKLLDFGLAKLAADVDRRGERTQSGVAIGTPMYMSPEQARGIDVDHRTDIYALGCVAYELLLGSPPFPLARSAPELYAAHLHEAPPLPRAIWPEIPPQLDLALFAMLAKDPAYRPTLAQIRSVIAAVRTSTPSQRAATEFVGPRLIQTRRRTTAIAAAMLICGIVIGALLTSGPSGELSRETPVAVPAALINVPVPTTREAPMVTIDAPTSRPRNAGSGMTVTAPGHGIRGGVSRPTRKAALPAIVVPISTDAGVDDIIIIDATPPGPAVVLEKTMPRSSKPLDRNQTIDPFAPKRYKVSP